MIEDIFSFNENLTDFILNRSKTFPDEGFTCSDCPGWCGEYCVIKEMWSGLGGWCEMDRENHRVILHIPEDDDPSVAG